MDTTLALLKKHEACSGGYEHLATALGGEDHYGRETPIPLSRILETNGLDHTLWALRAVLPEQSQARDRVARMFAADVAEHVLFHFERDEPGDARPREAIDAARAYVRGEIDDAALSAAQTEAHCAGAGGATAAARSAAHAAAHAAGGNVCRAAVWASDASTEEGADKWRATRDAEREWQRERLRQYLKALEEV
jgi:hypothetical protein